MSRLRFLSIISVAACSCGGGGGGGGGSIDAETGCGSGSAPASGLVASGTGFSFTYGTLSASANNDCPDPAAPAGVVSLTITGTSATGGFYTMCVKRPDHLGATALALGTDVQIVDVTDSTASCTYGLDESVTPTGTLTATGVCGNGTSNQGFAMTVTGTIGMKSTCAGTITPVSGALAGTVAVGGPAD
jgi:hypothetical protein